MLEEKNKIKEQRSTLLHPHEDKRQRGSAGKHFGCFFPPRRGCFLLFAYREMRKICKTCLMTGGTTSSGRGAGGILNVPTPSLSPQHERTRTHAHTHAAFLSPLTAAVGHCSHPLTTWHSGIPNASTIHLNSRGAAANYLCLHTRGMRVQNGERREACARTHAHTYSVEQKTI